MQTAALSDRLPIDLRAYRLAQQPHMIPCKSLGLGRVMPIERINYFPVRSCRAAAPRRK